MFYSICDEVWKTVLRVEGGEWLVSFTNPSAPEYVSDETLSTYKKCVPPKEYLINVEKEKHMSEAQKNRKDLISPLLENPSYITNKKERRILATQLAKNAGTTQRRVLSLYYKYLGRHTLIEPKNIKQKENENYKIFAWAINKYYFSAKKMSLKTSYDMMLLAKYTDENGKLLDLIPSWESFRYFYYNNLYHHSFQKEISREGLTSYQRNKKALFGNANHWKKKIGYFQMDATIADVYLVSRFDRKAVIGRPYIYLAVDTATELIAGIYVGLASDESAVLSCLVNAVENKVEFCSRYGIEIQQDQWPSSGLPCGIITDQGKEFTSNRIEELCMRYGMEIEILPPFRPDRKGLVEKTFDLLQSKYRPFLIGKGVIQKDANERWAVDYRSQATLTIYEFTQIVIHCVLLINGGRFLTNYVRTKEMLQEGVSLIPNDLWKWYLSHGLSDISPVDSNDIYKLSLPRKKASLTRKGIYHNGFQYQNKNISKLLQTIKNPGKITIAYDIENIKKIYLIVNNEYIEFVLGIQYSQFFDLSMYEYKIIKESEKSEQRELKHSNTELHIKTIQSIKNIVDSTDSSDKRRISKDTIQNNRKTERTSLQ